MSNVPSNTESSTFQAILEAAAERDEDLTPAVYRNFYARCPGAQAAFSHSDDTARGKMLSEFLHCLEDQVEGAGYLDGYLDTIVSDHRSYDDMVFSMYWDFAQAVSEAIRSVVGDQWSEAMERTWNSQVQQLLSRIESSHRQLLASAR